MEIKNPSVFCIDEPLNFLDSEGVSLLTNLIKKRASSNKSNILSSQEFVKLDEVDFEVIDLDEN